MSCEETSRGPRIGYRRRGFPWRTRWFGPSRDCAFIRSPVPQGAWSVRQIRYPTCGSFNHPGSARPSRLTLSNSRVVSHCEIVQLTRCRDDMLDMMHFDAGAKPVGRLQSKVFYLYGPVVTVELSAQVAHQIDRGRNARGRGLGGYSTRLPAPLVLREHSQTRRTALRNSRGVRGSPVHVRLEIGVGSSFVLRPHPPCIPQLIPRPPEAPRRAFVLGGEGWAS